MTMKAPVFSEISKWEMGKALGAHLSYGQAVLENLCYGSKGFPSIAQYTFISFARLLGRGRATTVSKV